jgi:hypothetical protein
MQARRDGAILNTAEMQKESKYIFWAHSPIGYETYLSLRKMGILNEQNSHLITARDCTPPEAECCIGLPEEYCWLSPEQFQKTQEMICTFLEKIDFKNNAFELIVPQTANFFIRCLIESPQCLQYHVFDEGSGARAPIFDARCKQIFYKYNVRDEACCRNFMKALGTDFDTLSGLYKNGVPFYEVGHRKFAGFMSFFNDAFPGGSVSIVPKSEFSGVSACRNYGLILLPPFRSLINKPDFKKKFQQIYISIQSIARLNTQKKWVYKFHPHDSEEIKQKIKGLLKYEEFTQFCERKSISRHREPAFMGFDVYVSAPNSTIDFLRSDKSQYIAIAN